MASSTSFMDAVKGRRTIYQLEKKSTISDDRIKELVTDAILHVPSCFNSQTTRLVVLLKKDHETFWDIVAEVLQPVLPAEMWEHMKGRIAGFHGAYGTVLFYEDPQATAALQKKMPMFQDKFPVWSEHTSAMHQYMLWTAFEAEGLGCNLQHNNPIANQRASDTWKIPADWDLKAQLVFGKPAADAQPKPKESEPLDKRLFFHGF